MKHYNINLQSLGGSPTNQTTSPSQHLLSPRFSKTVNRNGSMPDIKNYATAVPAGVINLIPKSTRESTLKIFKVRRKVEKDLLLQGAEQAIKRQLHRESIVKGEAPLNVEFLVEKGRKEYEQKKSHKLVGSMYVNDLWGKQYEGKVKRQAKIEWEMNNGELLKRKPLHLKLQEAAEFFEQKKKGSPKFGEQINFDSVSHHRAKSGFDIETDNYCKTDREAYGQKQFLLDEENELQRHKSDNRAVQMLPAINFVQKSYSEAIVMRDTAALSPKPSGFKERSQFAGQNRKDGTTIYEPSGAKTERIQLDTEFGSSTDVSDSNFILGATSSRIAKQKHKIEETKDALDNLINLCNKDVSEMKEIAGALNGVQKVFLKDVGGKKKRRDEAQKEQLMAKCADTLKRKRERQLVTRLSM